MTYNNRNRLASVTAGGITTNYVYNALGQRIEKSGAAVTLFAYDEAGHLIGEYDSGGNLIEETVWLGDLPVATLRPNGSGISVYYVHADHLGSPKMITQPSNNAILWRWDQDPFGTATPNQNPSGQGTLVYNLRFPGQYYDQETGLNYNYFRDLDTSNGRYVESDPIGLRGGINTYAYASDNPINNRDPLGLWDWPSLPQSVVDTSAGIGDILLLNQGAYLRQLLNINSVNMCSGSYEAGKFVGGAALLATGYGLVADLAAVKSTTQALVIMGQLVVGAQSLADLTLSEQLLVAVESSNEETIESIVESISEAASTRPTRVIW